MSKLVVRIAIVALVTIIAIGLLVAMLYDDERERAKTPTTSVGMP